MSRDPLFTHVAQFLRKVRGNLSSKTLIIFSSLYRIKSIEYKGDDETPKTVIVMFEKHSAAHTALMV